MWRDDSQQYGLSFTAIMLISAIEDAITCAFEIPSESPLFKAFLAFSLNRCKDC